MVEERNNRRYFESNNVWVFCNIEGFLQRYSVHMLLVTSQKLVSMGNKDGDQVDSNKTHTHQITCSSFSPCSFLSQNLDFSSCSQTLSLSNHQEHVGNRLTFFLFLFMKALLQRLGNILQSQGFPSLHTLPVVFAKAKINHICKSDPLCL